MHRPLLRPLRFGLATLATLALLACRAEAVDGEEGTPQSRFLASLCAAVGPCCEDPRTRPFGADYDPATCQGYFAIELGTSSKGLDEAREQRCLERLAARTGCDHPDLPFECKDVLARDGAPPGGACAKDRDCATDPRGTVVCSQEKRCVVTLGRGGGECVGAGFGNGAFVTSARTFVGTLCEGDKNQYCHGPSSRCVALGQEGAACSDTDFCTWETYCDPASRICTRTKPSGASCVAPKECESGSCSVGQCEGAFGDPGLASPTPLLCRGTHR